LSVYGVTPNPFPVQGPGGPRLSPSETAMLSKLPTELLKALGIDSMSKLTRVTVENGASKTFLSQGLREMTFLTINPAQANVLQTLGIPAHTASLAMAIHGGETVKGLKKKFKDIHQEVVDENVFSEVAQLFSTPQPSDAYVFSDQKGGIFLIRSSLQEIADSESEEDKE
jgi:hypothetical protein